MPRFVSYVHSIIKPFYYETIQNFYCTSRIFFTFFS